MASDNAKRAEAFLTLYPKDNPALTDGAGIDLSYPPFTAEAIEDEKEQAKYYNYGHSFFTQDLKLWTRAFLRVLPSDVTCLLSRGSSGCSIASAMLVLSERELYHIHIKKKGEPSHSSIAGEFGEDSVIAIVDDLVDTGETVRILVEAAADQYRKVKYLLSTSLSSHPSLSTFKGTAISVQL